MSKIVRVQDGDYKLIVGSSTATGDILLDTNPGNLSGGNGSVTITGDLIVQGNTTTIESETITLLDPIIYVNTGEAGDGVSTLGHLAGIQADRGTLSPVSFYWDETLEHYDLSTGGNVSGTFKIVTDSDDKLQTLALAGITSNNGTLDNVDLLLMPNGLGVLTVEGTIDYETRIIDYSLIEVILEMVTAARHTNVATIEVVGAHNLLPGDRVNIFCASDGTFNENFAIVISTPTDTTFTYSNIGADDLTKLVIGAVKPDILKNDDSIPNMKAVADYAIAAARGLVNNKIQEDATKVQVYGYNTSGVDKIEFEIDGDRRAVLANTGLTVDNIRLVNNNISNISNDNLLFDSVLNIPNRVSAPTAPLTGYVKLYSKSTPGTGGTGLYFKDTHGTNDELISKTKALLYSLIL
jgi:hypothetical protein